VKDGRVGGVFWQRSADHQQKLILRHQQYIDHIDGRNRMRCEGKAEYGVMIRVLIAAIARLIPQIFSRFVSKERHVWRLCVGADDKVKVINAIKDHHGPGGYTPSISFG